MTVGIALKIERKIRRLRFLLQKYLCLNCWKVEILALSSLLGSS